MAAPIAIVVLAFAAALALVSGMLLTVHHFLFIAKSYRVLGQVASEWNYRMTGIQVRYYRVDFCLSNGQPAHLRSGVVSSSKHPKVGQTVPVLICEESDNVKARIGTIRELWFEVFVLLFIGGSGSLLLLPHAYKIFSG